MWTKETLLYCWREYKLVQRLCKSVWNLIKPINTDLPCDPAGPLPCVYWKNPQLHVLHRDVHITVYDHMLFTIAKFWCQHWCPTIEEWIKKHTEICVCRKNGCHWRKACQANEGILRRIDSSYGLSSVVPKLIKKRSCLSV